MKKLFIFVAFMLFSCAMIAGNYLSGEIVVANPEKASITLNHEFSERTTGRFSYDGKSLSVEIGGKIFKNVEFGAGLGFKPDGALCFYVSLQDGIEIGAIEAQGTGQFYGQSVKISANPSYKKEFCAQWVSNSPFVLEPSVAGVQQMMVVPTAGFTSIPQLLLYSDGKIEPKFLVQCDDEGTLVEAYCIEYQNKIPNEGMPFTRGKTGRIDPALVAALGDNPYGNQSLIYTFMGGYSLTADNILVVMKGEHVALLIFENGLILKYAKNDFQALLPQPYDHFKKVLDMDKILSHKHKNRIYFVGNEENEISSMLKSLYLAEPRVIEESDGSLSHPDLNDETINAMFDALTMIFEPLLQQSSDEKVNAMTR